MNSSTPRDASSSETRSILSLQIPSFVVTSVSPTRTRNQDIFRPSDPSIAKRGRSSEPFNGSINGFLVVNGHSMSYFSGLIGLEAVSNEVDNVDPRERVNFASNPFFGKTPKFVDLGMSSSAPILDLEG